MGCCTIIKLEKYNKENDMQSFYTLSSGNDLHGLASLDNGLIYEKGAYMKNCVNTGDQWEKAYALAEKAHDGQVDKAGQPYLCHPLRVAQSFKDPKLRAAALLHDVLEDSKMTATSLLDAGIDVEIVKLVQILTRKKGESYDQYIGRIASNAKATIIKLADLDHNMDLGRLPEPTKDDYRRLDKYRRAQVFLRAALRQRGLDH